MKKEIKNIYQKILDQNLEINSILKAFPKEDFDNFNEELQQSLEQKDEFIQKLLLIKEQSEEELKSSLKESDLQEISEQINNLEQENLTLIQEKKIYLSKELNKTNKSAKALSAYKFNKQNKPILFDETSD